MDSGGALWQARRLTLRPAGSGKSYGVEAADDSGSTLATADAEGTIHDPAGSVVLHAPLRWDGRDDKPTNAVIEIAGADGSALGTVRVTKYGIGPRAKKLTLEVRDAGGQPALRLEPRDGRGRELALSSPDAELATMRVEQVKAGFLRKARVYTFVVESEVPAELRPLVLGTAVRYDALLNAAISAAAHDRL